MLASVILLSSSLELLTAGSFHRISELLEGISEDLLVQPLPKRGPSTGELPFMYASLFPILPFLIFGY